MIEKLEKIGNIGNELASLYGGSCYHFEVKASERKVIFYCIEYGEKFRMVLTFDELKNDYEIDL